MIPRAPLLLPRAETFRPACHTASRRRPVRPPVSPGTTSPPPQQPTTSTTTTSPPPATTTRPSNGVETPQPTQPGMVDNCNKFYFVKQGDTCQVVTSGAGITLDQFYAWNPSVGSTCSGMWTNVHVCVGVFDWMPPHRPYGCYAEVDQRALSYAGITGRKDMTVEY
ncbi:Putative LysM domain-containing protein [Colletotrichum destructivum]|uniref:LysM domain-containing protein n=1 Tax=Colletotrichum destructivum TaxID=34406 RepID=A0AAX4HW59_9PEZI|nr:Putative LysM domain-containing protein [Colletotrichum destructivum]